MADPAGPPPVLALEVTGKILDRSVHRPEKGLSRGRIMSVGSVTSSSLQRDLISALRQTRGASAQQTDANAFAVASDGASPSAGAAATTSSGSKASSPALSSDLMASLLKVQSDFSQISAQGGFAAPTSAQSITEASTDGSDDGQTQGNAAPARAHHGHHARMAGGKGSDSVAPGSTAV
ncbi:hypothetical protein FV228_24720, partial [Methylobacterium sp. WL18]